MYVKAVRDETVTHPGSKSFEVVTESIDDPLIEAKLHFFKSVAMQLVPFLNKYQTDAPMVVFLGRDLYETLKCVLRRFIKEDIIANANSATQLISIDVENDSNHNCSRQIDVGFSADRIVKELYQSKVINDKSLLGFKMDCKAFLVALAKTMMHKSPLTYVFVQHICCMDPQEQFANPFKCNEDFRIILTFCVQAQKVKECDCDELASDTVPIIRIDTFTNFDPTITRIDVFYSTHLNHGSKLFSFVKMIMVLSHGQATVERGFSINKEVEVENLKQENIVAQRIVCDAISSAGGISKFPLVKEMVMSCSLARQKYMAFLENQRELKKTEQQKRKRETLLEEVDDLKAKKKRLQYDVTALQSSADDYAEKAEGVCEFKVMSQRIAKSNAMRKAATSKLNEIALIEKEIEEKIANLK